MPWLSLYTALLISQSDQSQAGATTMHNNIMLTPSRQLSIALTIDGGQLPTSTALLVVSTSTETG